MTTRDMLKLKWVSANELKAVKNYVREIFLENEPMHKYLFSKECKDFRYFDRASSISDSINKGMSYMYITETGEIAALGLVGENDTNASIENDTPIQYKLKQLFGIIEDKVKLLKNLTGTDKEARFWVLSVHPDWIGHGLAKSLIEEVLPLVKFLGYTHIGSFSSCAFNTKLLETYGFKKLYSVRYADYTQDGEAVILPDEPDTHLSFMHKKLSSDVHQSI